MGNKESSFGNILGQLDVEEVNSEQNNVYNYQPIDSEGILLKITDNLNEKVYDHKITTSSEGNIQFEEYYTYMESNLYRIHREFVVISKELRECLRDLDIIKGSNRYENKPRLPESFIISQYSILEYKSQKHNILLQLIHFIRTICPIFGKMDEDIANGNIPIHALSYYFKIGTKVVIHNEHIEQGAIVDSVIGEIINLKIVSQNRHGQFIENKYPLRLPKKLFTKVELHKYVEPITENDSIYLKLEKMGRLIVNAKGIIKYLNYSGPVWENMVNFENYKTNIRVMVDLYHDFPDTYDERIEKLGSDIKTHNFVPDKFMFLVLGLIPVYFIKENRYIWVKFDQLEDIKFNENCYKELVLEQKYKEFLGIINFNKAHKVSIDSIKDKGKGLLFVLSGPPGVGKTMTVEALTEKHHIPLIMIDFGSLGVTPKEVEQTLKYKMKLAEYWNAVILFDEADVFLEARNNSSEIVRNAIVGVFLQALEYHPGVTFLTTNRETSLDPAILSRATLKIRYRPLTLDDSITIWQNMLNKIIDSDQITNIIFELRNNNICITNGRDIRNIIHNATIFAAETYITYNHIELALALNY